MTKPRILRTPPEPVHVFGDPSVWMPAVALDMEEDFFLRRREELVRPEIIHYFRAPEGQVLSVRFEVEHSDSMEAKEFYGFIWQRLLADPLTVGLIQILEGFMVFGEGVSDGIRPSEHPKRQEALVINMQVGEFTLARISPFKRPSPGALPVRTREVQVYDSRAGKVQVKSRLLGTEDAEAGH